MISTIGESRLASKVHQGEDMCMPGSGGSTCTSQQWEWRELGNYQQLLRGRREQEWWQQRVEGLSGSDPKGPCASPWSAGFMLCPRLSLRVFLKQVNKNKEEILLERSLLAFCEKIDWLRRVGSVWKDQKGGSCWVNVNGKWEVLIVAVAMVGTELKNRMRLLDSTSHTLFHALDWLCPQAMLSVLCSEVVLCSMQWGSDY